MQHLAKQHREQARLGDRLLRLLFFFLISILLADVLPTWAAPPEFVPMVKMLVQTHHPRWEGAAIQVTIANEQDVQRAITSLPYAAESLSFTLQPPKGARLAGKLAIPVQVSAGEVPLGRVYLYTQIRVLQEVLALKQDVPRGTVFVPAHFVHKEMDVSSLPDAYFTEASPLLHREAKSRLTAGTVVMDWMVREVPLFRRGETVQIQAGGEHFVVAAKGIALQDGVKNEKIRVRNLASGREVEATVQDHQVVTVPVL